MLLPVWLMCLLCVLALHIDPQLSRKLVRGNGAKGWLVHAWACVLR